MLVIQEQLEKTRSHLLSLLDHLDDDQLNWKPDERAWSIAQTVEHLAKTERGATKMIQIGLAEEPNFVPKDIPLEQLLPNRTRKISAPDYVLPTADRMSKQELQNLLDTTRQKLLDTIQKIEDPTLLDKTSPPMPFGVFGHLSTGQWLICIPLHEERHIQQISEVKELLTTLEK